MQANNIAKHVIKTDENYMLHIAVDETSCGVYVMSISMCVGAGVDEDGYAGDGDLAVNWGVDGLENTGGGDMGTLIMRGSNDEVGKVMGKFYWKHMFDARLRELLIAAGFSLAAARDVSGSEWGMQDEGRASYDAGLIADEVRKAMR